jgi:hypothetical protein
MIERDASILSADPGAGKVIKLDIARDFNAKRMKKASGTPPGTAVFNGYLPTRRRSSLEERGDGGRVEHCVEVCAARRAIIRPPEELMRGGAKGIKKGGEFASPPSSILRIQT